jgi:2-oxoglutarate ferredoxin oxidoreductase subunit delta
MPHYGVEKRGGISLSYVVISNKNVSNPKFALADIVVATTWRQVEIPKRYVTRKTIIINGQVIDRILHGHRINSQSLNMAILAILIKELNKLDFSFNIEKVEKLMLEKFKNKPNFTDNINAYNLGAELERSKYNISLDKMQKPHLDPLLSKDKNKNYYLFPHLCKGCGLCVEICPVKALSWSADNIGFLGHKTPAVDINKCIACKQCQNICPECAILINLKLKSQK